METWNRTQALLERNPRKSGGGKRTKFSGLLKGLLRCGSCGCSMIHTYTCKGTTRYRYYVCLKATKQGTKICNTRSIPAQEIEDFVVDRIATIGSDPELIRRVDMSVSAQRQARLSSLEAEKAKMGKSLRNQAKMVGQMIQGENLRLSQNYERGI